jgi:RNA polymerase sigma-70 factor (ECF subfamily)
MSDSRELYEAAVAEFGPALIRLAQSYERDPDRRQDLLQDIHFALWRSFAAFDQRCSVRTWTYRVAHNVASSHMLRDRRRRARPFVGLEALELSPSQEDAPDEHLAGRLDAERRRAQLVALLERLAPLDRQLMLLYLEGLDAASISEVTGLSSANVATKVHRIKRVLAAHVRAAASSSTTTGATHER